MEDDYGWWHPGNPDYQEERTLELRKLILDELGKAEAALGKSETGYQYADKTTLKIFWAEYEEGIEQEVVYRLQGDGFDVEFWLNESMTPEERVDRMYIDSVDRDDLAKNWLENPPERSIIDAETYLDPRPAFPPSA